MSSFSRTLSGLSLSVLVLLAITRCGSDAPPPEIKIVVAAASTIALGPCIPVTISLQDPEGATVTLTQDVTFKVNGVDSGAVYDSFDDCEKNKAATSITAASGSTSKKIYFKTYTAGKYTLSGESEGRTAGTTSITAAARVFTETGAGTGINGQPTRVVSTYVDDIERIWISGGFSQYKGVSSAGLVKVNPDGSAETRAVGTGFNTIVRDIELSTYYPGKIYTGGEFTSYNGTTQNRVARLNADFTLDTFTQGAGFANRAAEGLGFNPPVYGIHEDGSGNLFVAGAHATYDGSASFRLAKLSPAGALLPFVTVTQFNATVTDILPVSGSAGSFYIAGDFSQFGGAATNAQRIVKISAAGTKDVFAGATAFNATTFVLSKDPVDPTKILIGGTFTDFAGTTVNRIARLTSAGALDTFTAAGGFNGEVDTITPARDGSGDVYVGGQFTTYGGTTVNHIARLNNDGTLDTAFDVGVGFNFGVTTIAVAADGSGDIYVGGYYTLFQGTAVPGIARLTSAGALR